MQWIKSSLQTLREASASEPVPCPRGWGEVPFQLSLEGFPPWWWSIERKCPIGDAESCGECSHPFSPGAHDELRANLEQLTGLLQDEVLTEQEYALRRHQVLGLDGRTPAPPGFGYKVTAWILAPVALGMTVAGWLLVERLHQGFWGLLAAGLVALGLTISFAFLARARARRPDEQRRAFRGG